MMTIEVKLLIIAVILYFIWAIWHHRRDKSLTLPIFLEYVLTAVLVVIIFTGVLLYK